MGSKWRKAKLALTCLHVPSTLEDSSPSIDFGRRLSDAALLSRPLSPAERSSELSMPMTPIPSSSGLRLQKHCTKSSKRTCAICLTTMKPGQGHAIFTAECSHSFHFHCITSNVKHGNQSCPVCRAKWKEIPFQRPPDLPHESARVNTVNLARDDPWMNVLRRLPRPRPDANRHASSFLHATEHGNRHVSSFFHATEPGVFDDDELVDHQTEISEKGLFNKEDDADADAVGEIDVKTYPEVSAVSRSASHNNFTILIHLKALASRRHNSRAPVDLVTVLDISGSMAGTKLALLKRATGFVIQHLGPSDRLSVIAFSSTARRLFPLRRMTDTGRREALQAVNGLTSNGGTNIAEGLRKGAKVMTDRKWKNPVGSIILLSDGQDTYNISTPSRTHPRRDYQSLLPISIPVHAFGFGADHDAASMHLISEGSGGTFSFIEAESAIQDAFAQCIGGLLTVVVQELQVELQCVHPRLQLGSIKAGSYKTRMMPDSRFGSIDVGDLYVDEDRDFLVTVDIPVDDASCDDEMSLLKVRCVYRDPITKESVTLEESNELKIQRPKITRDLIVSLEVDRQRNRLQAAEAMAEARAAAEGGDLAGAASILLRCREVLLETASAQAGDQLCITLAAELREMQERMANHRVYEASGRAYVLSGLSSHSWQRATTRGHSTDGARLVQAYQTPSMVDMVTRSQTMFFGSSSPQPSVRPTRSFSGRPLAR